MWLPLGKKPISAVEKSRYSGMQYKHFKSSGDKHNWNTNLGPNVSLLLNNMCNKIADILLSKARALLLVW